MKLTTDNIDEVKKQFTIYNDVDYAKLHAILQDIEQYNEQRIFPYNLEAHIVEHHTQYSCERTDPCPDYYGTIYIKWENCGDHIMDDMNISGLDDVMCAICCAFEQAKMLSSFEQNVGKSLC